MALPQTVQAFWQSSLAPLTILSTLSRRTSSLAGSSGGSRRRMVAATSSVHQCCSGWVCWCLLFQRTLVQSLAALLLFRQSSLKWLKEHISACACLDSTTHHHHLLCCCSQGAALGVGSMPPLPPHVMGQWRSECRLRTTHSGSVGCWSCSLMGATRYALKRALASC